MNWTEHRLLTRWKSDVRTFYLLFLIYFSLTHTHTHTRPLSIFSISDSLSPSLSISFSFFIISHVWYFYLIFMYFWSFYFLFYLSKLRRVGMQKKKKKKKRKNAKQLIKGEVESVSIVIENNFILIFTSSGLFYVEILVFIIYIYSFLLILWPLSPRQKGSFW